MEDLKSMKIALEQLSVMLYNQSPLNFTWQFLQQPNPAVPDCVLLPHTHSDLTQLIALEERPVTLSS